MRFKRLNKNEKRHRRLVRGAYVTTRRWAIQMTRRGIDINTISMIKHNQPCGWRRSVNAVDEGVAIARGRFHSRKTEGASRRWKVV